MTRFACGLGDTIKSNMINGFGCGKGHLGIVRSLNVCFNISSILKQTSKGHIIYIGLKVSRLAHRQWFGWHRFVVSDWVP